MTEDTIVIQMIRDLTAKVDDLPTRHELNARFDALGERVKATEKDVTALQRDSEELKRGRLPSWAAPVGTVASAACAIVAIVLSLVVPHPQSALAAPPPIVVKH